MAPRSGVRLSAEGRIKKGTAKRFHAVIERPNYGLSGILEEDAIQKGLLPVKPRYSEPLDRCNALLPSPKLHILQNGNLTSLQSLSRSNYILGRDLSIPGACVYHAALQFRKPHNREPGLYVTALDGYVCLSGKDLEPDKFVEVLDQDVLLIGNAELIITIP